MQVGTALEAAAMRVTGTRRRAGRWLLSGSRARSAIGRRPTDHFENVPLGLGMNRESMLATAMERRLGLAVICWRHIERTR